MRIPFLPKARPVAIFRKDRIPSVKRFFREKARKLAGFVVFYATQAGGMKHVLHVQPHSPTDWGCVMPNHDVAAIANEFLRKAKSEGRALTHMQLQKLPYIAHGWGLAVMHEPLVRQSPQAWKYGPVYPDLYDALSRYGSGAVDDLVRENDGNIWADDRGIVVRTRLTDEEKKLINMVWERYKHKGGIELSAITHEPGTPWTETWNTHGSKAPIPDHLIANHYEALLEKNLKGRKKGPA